MKQVLRLTLFWGMLGVLLTACQQIENLEGSKAASLQASGIIQAEEINVAGEFGGQVLTITVSASDTVTKGQVLVQLDTALLDAQIQSAQAMV